MPNSRVNVTITQKGAIFNAAGTKASATRMVIQINDAIAQVGVDRVKTRLGHVLQHPTGHYRSRIQVDRRSSYRGITDGGIIYGGWLEGVTARNATTRFKGYHTFRIVMQDLNKDKEKIAQPLVDKFIGEMNS